MLQEAELPDARSSRRGRRRSRAPADGSWGLILLFLGLAALLLGRGWWEPTVAPGLLVEVSGQVARPGLHVVDPPTLARAVEVAGGIGRGVDEAPLEPGDAVEVGAEGARIVRARRPLLTGAQLDLDADPVDAIASVPGVSVPAAMAIVARADAEPRSGSHGGGASGAPKAPMSKAASERLASVSARPAPAPARMIDVNVADAGLLERLPGIGPALAARIVADREARGRFGSVADLDRVPGVGPATVARLEGAAVAGWGP